MPRIDPNQLLKCLSVLLSPIGGIKSREEVNRLQSLMTKFSKKLVSKCIYVMILKASEPELLDMFMNAGGWDLTFNWLSDGIEMKNWPLVEELVELLLICPVDIERLKGNNCPKIIKSLSKDQTATERSRHLASNVVDQWLAIVRGACDKNVAAPNAGPSVSQSPLSCEDSVPEVSSTTPAENGVVPPLVLKVKQTSPELIASSDSEDDKMEVDKQEQVEQEKEKEDKSQTESRQVLKMVNEDPVAQESLPPRKLAEAKRRELAMKRRGDKRLSPEPEKSKRSSDKRSKLDHKMKSRDKDKDRRSEKSSKPKSAEEKAQEEKDKQSLMKLITPSIGGLGKIPKKSSKDKDKDDSKKDDKKAKSTEDSKKAAKDPKKYNISIETRKGGEERPKTVKVFNSRLRSTGLEELPPPPRKKKDEPVVPEKKPLKRASPVKEVHVPEKKLKEEEKHPHPPPAAHPSPAPHHQAIEKPPVTSPTKPKVLGLQESDVFADALTAANTVKDAAKKKKRRTSTSSSGPESKKESPTRKIDEKESVKPVFKFYQDTLVTSEDKGDSKSKKEDSHKESKEEKEEVVNESEIPEMTQEELENEVMQAEKAIDQVLKLEEKKNIEREKNRVAKGILTYIKKYKSAKKSVRWLPDKDLTAIKYFELDETERVNVTKTFMDMSQMEKFNERILLSRKLVNEDIMEEKTPWRPLILIEIPPGSDTVIPGQGSLEKEIQRARERTTLQAIYFNRSLIPDSPGEPDLEIHAQTEPALIPLKDQTGNPESVISYKDRPWPEPKGYPPGHGGNVSPPEPQQPESPPHNGIEPPQMMPFQPPGVFPGQFPPGPGPQMPFPMQPGMMPNPEWMGNADGNMMMPPQGGDPMMMGAMGPGMPPGMMPPGGMPPDMFLGGPPPPDFMGGPPGFMGGPPGMFPGPGGPGGYGPGGPQHQDGPSGQRQHRPWYRNEDRGRGGGGGGGTWRHPSKGGKGNIGPNNGSWQSKKMCKYYLKNGICRQISCPFRHGPAKVSGMR